MTDPPPSRWKVIERGRRLEVIDTRAEGGTQPARGTGARPGLPRRLRFDGTLGWTTHPVYDLNGPRAVVLDGAIARWIGGAVAAVAAVLVVIVVVAGVSALPFLAGIGAVGMSAAKGLRPWLTRRLDLIAA